MTASRIVDDLAFETIVTASQAKIDEALTQLIPAATAYDERLYDAARYALLGGGKRLRPLLAIAVCKALGADEALALIPACALEMVHAYSLIHDDLPCMDDDDWRRGKPTLHRVYNEGTAVLTGDFLLTFAFEVIADAPSIAADQKIALIRALSSGAGGEGMIAGQMLDLSATHQKQTLQQLQAVHKAKTGALIIASALFGAIVANADEKQKGLVRNYAQAIGLAFQIADDILDVTDSFEKHGCAVSSDVKNGKSTYVTLLGLEGAKDAVCNCLNEAFQYLDSVNGDVALLKWQALQMVKKAIL